MTFDLTNNDVDTDNDFDNDNDIDTEINSAVAEYDIGVELVRLDNDDNGDDNKRDEPPARGTKTDI